MTSCSPISSAAIICSRPARKKGVKRIVFASSNHAVGFYIRAITTIGTDVTARPDSRYGVSKVFGEAGRRVVCRQARA